MAREEAIAPSAARAAARKNSDQERRRNRGGLNARFEVIRTVLVSVLHGQGKKDLAAQNAISHQAG